MSLLGYIVYLNILLHVCSSLQCVLMVLRDVTGKTYLLVGCGETYSNALVK